MTKVIVDGTEVDVPGDFSLLQACEAAGAEIPRFCFHERLSIAGNCRMCLIEVKGAPKPVASCAQQVRDQRPGPNGEPPVLITNSAVIKKAREGVMEFLLLNHPLDCPICDQGGECDLQDQAMGYGRDDARTKEFRRAVTDKYMGPLVKTVMTRCIQCTRCVRFVAEVAGVEEIGASGRGEDMEITTYLEKSLTSELSANIIDLCPVGALTSKPYAFNARPWELRKTESIDAMDAIGSNIRIDARGPEVLRVLPRVNDDVNEEWISDKTRFVVDGLGRQRLDKPYIRRDGKLQPATWDEALAVVADKLKSTAPAKIAAITGDLVSVEPVKALKDLLASFGVASLDCRQDGAKLGGPRTSYLFNSTIAGIEDADAILLVGTNPRWEAPLVNSRIRKAWLRHPVAVARIGAPTDLTYPVSELGEDFGVLGKLAAGEGDFAEALKNAKHPMVIVGQSALARADGAAILAAAAKLAAATGMIGPEGAEGWCGFNVLHDAAGRVGALDAGFLPAEGGRDVAGILDGAAKGDVEVVWLLGADEIDTAKLGNAFVIYQGSHGDAGAHRANVILPGAAYTEEPGLFVNTEGRVQKAERAVFPPGEARENWKIIRAVSGAAGKPLPYDDLTALRAALTAAVPHFGTLDTPAGSPGADTALWSGVGAAGEIAAGPVAYKIKDFYLTNPIARASKTMAECSREFIAVPALQAAE
ncbi:NADH-quinone oxidoreductase chain 3 [Alphaproteobacteria bacterium SO-S41]|nr:NADH-quinone oxidoreductase chain 3 [Alphaproteobacteria bacterium SO-S41]